ncbi:YafY family protein [Paenibacillus sp. P46E]|uniref:helix-turn-helix transcriptional regulator n=1 Tax=Paenibacillus sp. P46E TaxID=1349436 RepID=UPI00093CB5E0|nr:YafY family protein [Paenibacillus sp. P46E]OKP96568.1 transcriptional regulator [Paenibacillus sp. P46E]
MRLHRLIAILLLLESRGKMKAKELAEALETSVRSIYRDIDVLAESGIPMVTTSGPGGGISLMEGYTVNLQKLHGEEVINLYLTGMGIPFDAWTESGLMLRNALLKLENTLPAAYQEDIRKAKDRFYYDNTPWWEERTEIPCLEQLRSAVWRCRCIQIQYRKVNGELTCRNVQPYGLIVKQGDWYLAAYCESAEAIRTFKCDRITSAEVTEGNYMIPEDFALEEYWLRGSESFKQSCKQEEYYPVVVRSGKDQQTRMKQYEIVGVLESDELMEYTLNLYSYESACRQVMNLLNETEIVSPPEIRRYIQEQLVFLQKVYS